MNRELLEKPFEPGQIKHMDGRLEMAFNVLRGM
jgi:hypothetical protein